MRIVVAMSCGSIVGAAALLARRAEVIGRRSVRTWLRTGSERRAEPRSFAPVHDRRLHAPSRSPRASHPAHIVNFEAEFADTAISNFVSEYSRRTPPVLHCNVYLKSHAFARAPMASARVRGDGPLRARRPRSGTPLPLKRGSIPPRTIVLSLHA